MQEKELKKWFYGYTWGILSDSDGGEELFGAYSEPLDYSRYTAELNCPEDFNVVTTLPAVSEEILRYLELGLDSFTNKDLEI